MNVVFLCPNVPEPPLNGGHHRNLRLIRSLARFASVHVFAIGDPRGERAQAAAERLSAAGATISVHRPTGPGRPEDDAEDVDRLPDAAAHFRSPELAAALARHFEARPVDVAHVEEVVMAQYVDLLPCPRVIDRQKVDWAYHEAMAHVVGASASALAHLQEAARFRWWERRLAGLFDRILVPGDGDRKLLEPLHGPDVVEVLPIGIGDDLAPPPGPIRTVEHALLFGALDYGPNVEAQQWFFREVWPSMRAAEPSLGAVVAGSGRPPLDAERLPSDSSVRALGFVPDTRSLLQGPGVLIVPLRVGGGARTKVLEALACGMPVVSTALGAENLGLVPGRDFLLAESAADMAGAISRLARDPGLATSLGRAGAARAEAFRWSRIEATIEPLYRDVAAGAHAAARAASLAHAGRVPWATPAPVVRLRDDLAARERGAAGTVRGAQRRAMRRLRRTSLMRRVEAALDSALEPPRGPGLRGQVRRRLADVLRRLGRALAASSR